MEGERDRAEPKGKPLVDTCSNYGSWAKSSELQQLSFLVWLVVLNGGFHIFKKPKKIKRKITYHDGKKVVKSNIQGP